MEDMKQYALRGATERLKELREEEERIYALFPNLREAQPAPPPRPPVANERKVVAVDASQIEYRIFAHFANDPEILRP